MIAATGQGKVGEMSTPEAPTVRRLVDVRWEPTTPYNFEAALNEVINIAVKCEVLTHRKAKPDRLRSAHLEFIKAKADFLARIEVTPDERRQG